jgi:antitoxin (DNA-binding transcriptional repressor) of toxin-antitoxin stability system
MCIVKPARQTYTVKEFSANPSRAIHRALQGVEVTITLHGVPAVRLVPLGAVQDAPDEVLLTLAGIPGFRVAQCSPRLAPPSLRLAGTGPSPSEVILEDRR